MGQTARWTGNREWRGSTRTWVESWGVPKSVLLCSFGVSSLCLTTGVKKRFATRTSRSAVTSLLPLNPPNLNLSASRRKTLTSAPVTPVPTQRLRVSKPKGHPKGALKTEGAGPRPKPGSKRAFAVDKAAAAAEAEAVAPSSDRKVPRIAREAQQVRQQRRDGV